MDYSKFSENYKNFKNEQSDKDSLNMSSKRKIFLFLQFRKIFGITAKQNY